MVRRIYLSVKRDLLEVYGSITSIIGRERAKVVSKRERFEGIELGPIEVNEAEAKRFDSLPSTFDISVADINEGQDDKHRNHFGHLLDLDTLKPRDYP